ncbi:hypothetical protein P43SY_007567 [Pythium insidiosum]|uniref:Hpc2-related domain-containing protein n=1 Tax=Pythium insidiosum TaxID=114742 RepID=A0AAD5QBT0_PYTIN|nr:hypothetical protein P43SY_007567 [Pythium insidiosum]
MAMTSTVAPRRLFFVVPLTENECCEINFKDLVRQQQQQQQQQQQPSDGPPSDAEPARPAPPLAQDPDGADSDAPALATPRTQRFNIIERLEKRYGGGAVVGPPVLSGGGGIADPDTPEDDADDGAERHPDDDDLYDSDDSFIDDSELQQNIEEIHTQARVKTKHSGFFVNAGDEIETVDGADADDGVDAVEPADDHGRPALKKAKKAKKTGAESSRAVKAFLEDWSDAASEWKPGADAQEALEALRLAVREMTETTPFTKVFPRQLDDALRAVDKLVVDAHPNKWRVNGYFATLMTFLPFTKQYLKASSRH